MGLLFGNGGVLNKLNPITQIEHMLIYTAIGILGFVVVIKLVNKI